MKYPFPFKGKVGMWMGFLGEIEPIPTPALHLKGRENRAVFAVVNNLLLIMLRTE